MRLPQALIATCASPLPASHACALPTRICLPACRYGAHWSQALFGWELMHVWMMSGRFQWEVPLLGTWVTWQHPGGKPPCDWWGINYYSRWGGCVEVLLAGGSSLQPEVVSITAGIILNCASAASLAH